MLNEFNIKVCGMREATNIKALLDLNIDYMGLIFYPKSPRFVEQVPAVIFPERVKKTGVFVNASVNYIQQKIKAFGLDSVQLHGKESVQTCQKIKKTGCLVFKVFHVDNDFDFRLTQAYAPVCDYFLFDTKGKKLGGNGFRFDWEKLDEYQGNTPFWLSGGIGLESLEDLKKVMHPQLYGLDLNSRFEDSAGIKNIQKINQFISALCKHRQQIIK